ncbi:MAG: septum formation inhibitor Maf, partial [Betaproteobacteria bacterium]|nr:septum formation inhibitor Maf [Betaproteobacteria bacterium]
VGTAHVQRHALSVSRVQFGPWTDAGLETYLDHGEWAGKAGAYAIQGLAAAHIAHIDGSYSGIMGLPLYETAQLLREPWGDEA